MEILKDLMQAFNLPEKGSETKPQQKALLSRKNLVSGGGEQNKTKQKPAEYELGCGKNNTFGGRHAYLARLSPLSVLSGAANHS